MKENQEIKSGQKRKISKVQTKQNRRSQKAKICHPSLCQKNNVTFSQHIA